MTEQSTGDSPIPDYANHKTIASHMIGYQSFTETLDLQGWILDLLKSGFTPAAEPGTSTSGQRILSFDDPAGAVCATVEYGGCWTARTALRAGSTAPESWWAASSGLIPAQLIVAAASEDAPATAQVGKLLEASGWHHAVRHHAPNGVAVALDAWTGPGNNRTAVRRDEGVNHGWLLSYSDLRRVTTITASLDTPPAIIAALATTS